MMITITHQDKSQKNILLMNDNYKKTKYHKTIIEPNKFKSQIKLMNMEIQLKKYTSHKPLNINKKIYHNALDNS